MTELLSNLAGLTLGGSAAILILALTARFSRARYAARWRCWVWLILCLRLAVPLDLPIPELPAPTPSIEITVPSDRVLYTYQTSPDITITPPVPAPPSMSDPESTQPPPESLIPSPAQSEQGKITLFDVAGWIWLMGIITVLGWYAVAHLRFLAYLRRWGEPVVNAQTIRLFNQVGNCLDLNRRPRLLVCSGLQIPLLAGLISPCLLLPEGAMGEQELRYSILHELTHFKRRDIWLKTLALVVTAIHWFNPIVWYMNRLVERDTELACDEGVLRLLPPEEHKAYGATILTAVEKIKTTH